MVGSPRRISRAFGYTPSPGFITILSFHLCTAEQEDNLSAGKCEFGGFSSIGGSSPARKRRRTQILKPARKRAGQQNETINQKEKACRI
jgi:hypothetical protein